ncbi:hypothetical protein F5B20DRAFT_500203 [Whalleya microplaca]|nr:hypothetical protein F5B20DRAFT_500203 [Whalleya microplaca]
MHGTRKVVINYQLRTHIPFSKVIIVHARIIDSQTHKRDYLHRVYTPVASYSQKDVKPGRALRLRKIFKVLHTESQHFRDSSRDRGGRFAEIKTAWGLIKHKKVLRRNQQHNDQLYDDDRIAEWVHKQAEYVAPITSSDDSNKACLPRHRFSFEATPTSPILYGCSEMAGIPLCELFDTQCPAELEDTSPSATVINHSKCAVGNGDDESSSMQSFTGTCGRLTRRTNITPTGNLLVVGADGKRQRLSSFSSVNKSFRSIVQEGLCSDPQENNQPVEERKHNQKSSIGSRSNKQNNHLGSMKGSSCDLVRPENPDGNDHWGHSLSCGSDKIKKMVRKDAAVIELARRKTHRFRHNIDKLSATSRLVSQPVTFEVDKPALHIHGLLRDCFGPDAVAGPFTESEDVSYTLPKPTHAVPHQPYTADDMVFPVELNSRMVDLVK